MEEYYLIIAPDYRSNINFFREEFCNTLFKNADGVFNIPRNLEDIIKSYGWFGNKPYIALLVSTSQPMVNDWSYLIWDASNNTEELLRYGKCTEIDEDHISLANQFGNISRMIFANWPKGAIGKLIATSSAIDPIKGIDESVLRQIVNKEEIKFVEANEQYFEISKVFYL